MKLDKIHYSFRSIDGFNKSFNAIISAREAGKSTMFWVEKAYKSFKKDESTTMAIRRYSVDISKEYIDDIQEILRKFIDEKITFEYSSSSFKQGVVDIYLNEKRFIRIISLSIPASRFKSMVLRNLKYIVFDEFICNVNNGERYLKNEANKFKELFNTFQRESKNLKCYLLGNPYSLYNPYFSWFGVDYNNIKKGKIYVGNNFAIDYYLLKEELKEKILKKNPLYKFEDDEYMSYALDGVNTNDININVIKEIPLNYSKRFTLFVENNYLCVYKRKSFDDKFKYYIKKESSISKKENVICQQTNEMRSNFLLLNQNVRLKLIDLKLSFEENNIAYDSIECYYLFEEFYKKL